MAQNLSEQELQRREKLDRLKALGIEPYPAAEFKVDCSAEDILKNYESNKTLYKAVSFAGRIMRRRMQGKAAFVEMQDVSARIQVYFNRDEICPGEDKTMYNEVFKKLVDTGDIIGIKGYVFTTQVGEITIHANEFILLTKSVKPLPQPVIDADGKVHDAFSDPEQKYRQRYVDLNVNPEVRETFVQRSQLVNTMRSFLSDKGYLEVETPILQPIYGGAAAPP